jgi:hypothetical protein
VCCFFCFFSITRWFLVGLAQSAASSEPQSQSTSSPQQQILSVRLSTEDRLDLSKSDGCCCLPYICSEEITFPKECTSQNRHVPSRSKLTSFKRPGPDPDKRLCFVQLSLAVFMSFTIITCSHPNLMIVVPSSAGSRLGS